MTTLQPTAAAQAQCAEYDLSSEPVPVRLVRVELDTGEVEVLITSLLDETAYPTAWFKALYHLRWGIEEGYKRKKSRIEIENFSGKSALVMYQDFHAKVLALNLASLFAWVAQAIADRLYAKRRYPYQIDFANALTQMKNRLVRWLLDTDPWGLVMTVVTRMARSTEPLRPNRSAPRKVRSQKLLGYHGNYKRTR